MATSIANPVAENAKPKWKLAVKWLSKDGQTWKTAESEREFSIPEKITDVSINVTNDDGSQEVIKRDFERFLLDPNDIAGSLMNLMNENLLFVAASFLYGADLLARNTVKGPAAAEVEGPGKMIRKQAENLVRERQKSGGKPITLERAIELVKALMEAE